VTSSDSPVTICHCSFADVAAVHRLGADTANHGAPVEAIFEDRHLFIDIFMRPYTAHFLDWCWVANHDGTIVGYLTGCPDTEAYLPRYRRALARAALRMLCGRYRLGPRTARAGLGFLRDRFSRHYALDYARFPAHFHVNVAADYRHQGIGRRLMSVFLDRCRVEKVPGVHLTTSTRNEAAICLYEGLGFSILDQRHSHYHSTNARQPVEAVAMGLCLH
jgi:ribosomal protein S18 acetylase RimI-like enzyme